MWVPYLGQEDPLEEGMANHSSILAWKIPWTEEFGAHAHSNMMLFKGGLFGEINDLIKDSRELLCPFYYVGTQKVAACTGSQPSPHNTSASALIVEFPNCERCFLFKPPNLWYSVIAAWMN